MAGKPIDSSRMSFGLPLTLYRRLTIKHLAVPRFRTGGEDGRYTATLKYKAYEVQVATGYDVLGDKFPFHVYIRKLEGGSQKKIECLPGQDDSKASALNRGVAFATAYIDAAI